MNNDVDMKQKEQRKNQLRLAPPPTSSSLMEESSLPAVTHCHPQTARTTKGKQIARCHRPVLQEVDDEGDEEEDLDDDDDEDGVPGAFAIYGPNASHNQGSSDWISVTTNSTTTAAPQPTQEEEGPSTTGPDDSFVVASTVDEEQLRQEIKDELRQELKMETAEDSSNVIVHGVAVAAEETQGQKCAVPTMWRSLLLVVLIVILVVGLAVGIPLGLQASDDGTPGDDTTSITDNNTGISEDVVTSPGSSQRFNITMPRTFHGASIELLRDVFPGPLGSFPSWLLVKERSIATAGSADTTAAASKGP